MSTRSTTKARAHTPGRILAAILAVILVVIVGVTIFSILTQQFGLMPFSLRTSLLRSVDSDGMGESGTLPALPSSNMMLFDKSNLDQSDTLSFPAERRMIKTGGLDLVVPSVATALTDIRAIAAELDGFVSEAQTYAPRADRAAATITVRVPEESFDTAVARLKAIASDVREEHINASDVTEAVADLEARLRNAQAEETRYLEILKRAKTISDTLQVVERLNAVRGTIEQLQAQRDVLSRQVTLSSITVTLTAEIATKVWGLHWRPLVVARQAVVDLLQQLAGFADFLIRAVILLPVLLLWLGTIALILFLAWRSARWIRRRMHDR